MSEGTGAQVLELLIASGIAVWMGMEEWERNVLIARCRQFIDRVFFQVRSDLVLIEARKVVVNNVG